MITALEIWSIFKPVTFIPTTVQWVRIQTDFCMGGESILVSTNSTVWLFTCRKTLRKHSKYNQYDQYGQMWLREFYFTWIQRDSSQLCAATSLILLQTSAVFYCGFYSGFCSRASSRSDQYHQSQIYLCNDGLQPVLLHTQSACSCVCFYSVLLIDSTVGEAGLWHHQSRLCFRSSDRSVG